LYFSNEKLTVLKSQEPIYLKEDRAMTFRRLRLILVLALLAIVLLGSVSVASAQDQTYVVQPGDTLFTIATRFGLTVQQLAAANGITNPNLIYAGQALTIPGGSGNTGGNTGGSAGTSSYTIVAGDTLSAIARRFGTTVATLAQLNGLANVDVLYIGQVLVLPGQPAPTAAATAAATSAATTAATAAPQPTATPVETITYTVKSGDTLGQIALRFGTTYQTIALLNNLANPDVIYPGQVLIIRQGTVNPTPQPTAAATGTPVPTAVAATATPQATPTETVEPIATLPPGFSTPTPIVSMTEVPAGATNLLTNPGLEGNARAVGDGSVNVLNGWEPFYCDQPYADQRCRALRLGNGNRVDLMMSRPAFQATTETSRVHSGTSAQQWSCTWQACRGGIYQTVTTTPGQLCEAGAYVQSWSSNDALSFTSDLLLQADRENSTWFIIVNPGGGAGLYAGNNEYMSGVSVSRGFGYDDDIYDQYTLIKYSFTATGSQTTVFFENLRLWPFTVNVNYIDDAYLRCTP
jgi:LysM repeat protein